MSEIAMGIDIGRKQDSTAIVVVERLENGILNVRALKELVNVPFEAQIAEIVRRHRRWNPGRAIVDQTGMGLPVTERLYKEIGFGIEGLTFTRDSKGQLVDRAVVLFQDGKIRWGRDDLSRRLRDQLHTITREISRDGNIKYVVADSLGISGHADLAWAFLLALRGVQGSAEAVVFMVEDNSNLVTGYVPSRVIDMKTGENILAPRTDETCARCSGHPRLGRPCPQCGQSPDSGVPWGL